MLIFELQRGEFTQAELLEMKQKELTPQSYRLYKM